MTEEEYAAFTNAVMREDQDAMRAVLMPLVTEALTPFVGTDFSEDLIPEMAAACAKAMRPPPYGVVFSASADEIHNGIVTLHFGEDPPPGGNVVRLPIQGDIR